MNVSFMLNFECTDYKVGHINVKYIIIIKYLSIIYVDVPVVSPDLHCCRLLEEIAFKHHIAMQNTQHTHTHTHTQTCTTHTSVWWRWGKLWPPRWPIAATLQSLCQQPPLVITASGLGEEAWLWLPAELQNHLQARSVNVYFQSNHVRWISDSSF